MRSGVSANKVETLHSIAHRTHSAIGVFHKSSTAVGWSVRNGVNSNTSNVHFFDYQSGTLINPEAKQEYTWGNVVSPEEVSSARPGLCAGRFWTG